MEPHSRCIVAIMLFILTASSSGAPTSGAKGQDGCLRVQSSSSRLNTMAQLLLVQMPVGIGNTMFSSDIPWIETQDMCKPASLRDNATPCMLKMSAVLRSYHSEVELLGQLPLCSNFTKQIEPAMQDFNTDMGTCARATRDLHLPGFSVPTVQPRVKPEGWEDTDKCRYIMERLFSFSVVGARVFALGDPARHGHGHSPAACM